MEKSMLKEKELEANALFAARKQGIFVQIAGIGHVALLKVSWMRMVRRKFISWMFIMREEIQSGSFCPVGIFGIEKALNQLLENCDAGSW
jgi:hypothetical protein